MGETGMRKLHPDGHYNAFSMPPGYLRVTQFVRIEPGIRPLVRRLVNLHLSGLLPACPVWSCQGHPGLYWFKSGEFARIARGEPYIVFGAKARGDLEGAAAMLLRTLRGPMRLVHVRSYGTLTTRLHRALPGGRFWAMIVFDGRRALKPIETWAIHGGKKTSSAVLLEQSGGDR